MIYVASKARHAPWWRALRAAGVPLAASWLDWKHNQPGADEPTSDDWALHWQRCIDEASACDFCLFVSNEGETACGALLEGRRGVGCGQAGVRSLAGHLDIRPSPAVPGVPEP